MDIKYTTQDRGNKKDYQQYLQAMDAISIEKVASASVFFQPKDGNTIVDVGMASGTSTAILAQLFPNQHIIGVDINPKMVEIANDLYTMPNLTFKEDDGEKLLTFEENTISGFINCSAIHHITSYNDYDSNRALSTLKRQVDLLKENGILVIRDFVKVEQKEVVVELSTLDKKDRPNDADLFIQFSKTARSLATEQGFPIAELPSLRTNTKRFQAYYTDVVEFVRRKDYYANWNIELQEEYGYYTQSDFETIFKELGLRIIVSAPIYNQWIINNRYKGEFTIYDLNGNDIGFPPTNYLIAGEKVVQGKDIQLVRHLPKAQVPFLKHSSFINKNTKQIYDVVERPNSVIDIIPYRNTNEGLKIIAKHGYPRPLANLNTDSPIIDCKHYSGYITEGIALGESNDLCAELQRRFKIQANETMFTNSLSYYTSPGGINERVKALFLPLEKTIKQNLPLDGSITGFKDSGFLHEYDAAQLLSTAQTGALVEARLELNIYNLFFNLKIALPKWLGLKPTITTTTELKITNIHDLLSINTQVYENSLENAEFMRSSRAYFSETKQMHSNTILEYVYPRTYSCNTVVTIPVVKKEDQVYIGLERRDLPVPQSFSGNSSIVTVPAFRLNKNIAHFNQLEQYLSSLKIEGCQVTHYSKLGEKYFPSIGITPEQAYPYLVHLDKPSEQLYWVSLDELLKNIQKIQDAHLLIAIFRLNHCIKNQ